MPAIVVPELKQKFALLRAYPAPRSWTELAKAFHREIKSVQTWRDGSQTRAPDRVPDWAVPILARLVAEALPGPRSDEEIRQFVFGPAAQLEEEIRTGAAVSLLALIRSEARHNTATLIRRSAEIGLVEIETEDQPSGVPIKLDEFFRLELRRRLSSGYVIALQHTQQVWALLPFAPSPLAPAMILVPGVKDSGEPAFMRERRDLGRHLFIILETPDPPPASVLALGRDETVLDKRALDRLAAFYDEQPKERRAGHLVALEFTASDPA
jgi:hypothetical protein